MRNYMNEFLSEENQKTIGDSPLAPIINEISEQLECLTDVKTFMLQK